MESESQEACRSCCSSTQDLSKTTVQLQGASYAHVCRASGVVGVRHVYRMFGTSGKTLHNYGTNLYSHDAFKIQPLNLPNAEAPQTALKLSRPRKLTRTPASLCTLSALEFQAVDPDLKHGMLKRVLFRSAAAARSSRASTKNY